MMAALGRGLKRLPCAWGAAVRFLTVLPWGRWEAASPEDLGCAAALFPWVGALVGLGLVAVRRATLALGGTPALTAALVLTAWVALTGGLHLDGLMDAADGLFGGQSPAQRLEIMRDERVGAFGALAAGLVLLLKFAALETAPTAAVLFAPVVGRWALVLAMAAFPYARPQGLGRMWYDQVGWRALAGATAASGLVAVVLGWPRGWAAWGLAAGVIALAALGALRRLPGLTGDLYGALAEMAEVVVLLAATLGGG